MASSISRDGSLGSNGGGGDASLDSSSSGLGSIEGGGGLMEGIPQEGLEGIADALGEADALGALLTLGTKD